MRVIAYSVSVAVQFAIIILLYAFLAPSSFAREVDQPLGIVFWAVGIGLPLSLFEYLYHRYLLHSAVLPFLASMHRAHTTHHGHTYVKAPITAQEPARLVEVRSEFPVEHEHQEEAMMFPFYSLPIFVAVFFLLIGLPLMLLFPASPIVLALILSVTAYYSAYEIWHAILHLPFERFWQPFLEARFSRKIARHMYGFHLMHHWRPTSNLAIVGFWGIALWDHVFRTHRRPERMPLQGAEVNYLDAKLARPLWPIAILDGWQGKLARWSRKVERVLAHVFLRRPLN